MIRNSANTVVAWSNADPDELSKRFWNILLKETYDVRRGWPEFIALYNLFALPLGHTSGKYEHHDGWRCS